MTWIWDKIKWLLLPLGVVLYALLRKKPSWIPSESPMGERIDAVNESELSQRASNKAERAKRLAKIELDKRDADEWINTHTDPSRDVCRNQVDLDPEAKKLLEDNKTELYL